MNQQLQQPETENWSGTLEFVENVTKDQSKVTHEVPFQVTANVNRNLKLDNWPSKLIMRLVPKPLLISVYEHFLKYARRVIFQPNSCDALDALKKLLTHHAGLIRLNNEPNPPLRKMKVLILMYIAEENKYLGLIPVCQGAFIHKLRRVIKQSLKQYNSQENAHQPSREDESTSETVYEITVASLQNLMVEESQELES